MISSHPYHDDGLDRCNHTELLQLCRRNGFQLHPATPKFEMVELLRGERQDWIPDPLDSARNGLIRLIQDHWKQVEVQIKCPARELAPVEEDTRPEPNHPSAPRACYRCPSAQIVSCLIHNVNHEREIKLRRKENPMTLPTTYTIDTLPKTAEELSKIQGFKLNQLWRELHIKVHGADDADARTAEVRALSSPEKAKLILELRAELDAKLKPAGKPAGKAAGKFTGKNPGKAAAPPPEEDEEEAEKEAEEEEAPPAPARGGKFQGKTSGRAPTEVTLESIREQLVQAELASANRETKVAELVAAQNGLLITVLAGLAAQAGASEDDLGDWMASIEPLAEKLKELAVAKK